MSDEAFLRILYTLTFGGLSRQHFKCITNLPTSYIKWSFCYQIFLRKFLNFASEIIWQ